LVEAGDIAQSNCVCRVVVTSGLLHNRLENESLSQAYRNKKVVLFQIVVNRALHEARDNFQPDRITSCWIQGLGGIHLDH
jgi:hypothetical protein